jgi:hypothetical protein
MKEKGLTTENTDYTEKGCLALRSSAFSAVVSVNKKTAEGAKNRREK